MTVARIAPFSISNASTVRPSMEPKVLFWMLLSGPQKCRQRRPMALLPAVGES
jgi:hypothetical protein